MKRTARVAVAVELILLLASASATASSGDADKLWVFFTDKGVARAEETSALILLRGALSERTLERRLKAGLDVNVNDLPVSPAYVKAVAATGARVETRSRWLNAVSVSANAAQAAAIAELPFVRAVRPVARAARPLPVLGEPRPQPAGLRSARLLDYGASLGQLEQIAVPALHDAGFDGSGILIAVLDTGFDTDHECFRHLDIVAERDFINDDGETAQEPGDPPGQDSHGTGVLSCIGAAKAGVLYGGAYDASFALAKTENVKDEVEIEEDYWVEAVEWADSLGADVITSSLGYFDWYTYEDMDGNTAATTIAADMAAARGIVMVNSMGNEGATDWGYMIAPADGDSVLSVGAVDSTGARASFSSVGPTYDGRTKPDVMAQGVYVHVATTEDTASYSLAHGTSFSAPLTASAVCLLLEGHSDWTPTDVIEALHSTASMYDTPDNFMGWGIVNAYDAMYLHPVGTDDPVTMPDLPGLSVFPNPIVPGACVEFSLSAPALVKLAVYDVSGRLVRTLVDAERPRGTFATSWDATDAVGSRVANGVYFVRVTAGERSSQVKVALVH